MIDGRKSRSNKGKKRGPYGPRSRTRLGKKFRGGGKSAKPSSLTKLSRRAKPSLSRSMKKKKSTKKKAELLKTQINELKMKKRKNVAKKQELSNRSDLMREAASRATIIGKEKYGELFPERLQNR